MERVSLVCALLLLSECLFSVFKVYDKESLFEFHLNLSFKEIICSMDCKTFQRIFCLFCFQKAKETKNTSADCQAKEIIFSIYFKTSWRIISRTILFSKKQKKLKTVQLITKRKKLYAQLIAKQIANSSGVSKRKKSSAQLIAQQTANSSADYHTKEIIYPMDFKTT